MEDYSKERILCATIHSYIGNVYYFPVRKDVFKGVFELGMKLVEKREYDIFCDDFLKEIEKSIRVIKAAQDAKKRGSGVVSLNGKMIDKPIIERAERALSLAKAAGLDINFGGEDDVK